MPRKNPYQERQRQAAELAFTSQLPLEACEALLFPDQESHTVRIIRNYLQTPGQKDILDRLNLSIEDLLNGRFSLEQTSAITQVFANWNQRLGRPYFAF